MFYLKWLSFYSFFILFNPRGPAYHGYKKTFFFWNRGLYVLELIPYAGENERFLLRCFLRYIEIIPEYTRSILNFFPFFCVKLGKKRAVLNGSRIQITFF